MIADHVQMHLSYGYSEPYIYKVSKKPSQISWYTGFQKKDAQFLKLENIPELLSNDREGIYKTPCRGGGGGGDLFEKT